MDKNDVPLSIIILETEILRKKDIKIAIVRIEGTNCEQESFNAFKHLGAQPEFVHLKQLLHMDCSKDETRDLSDFQCIMIPGGFSSGDYIRAGAIFAARIKSKLSKQLENYVNEGYPMLGVCNGFQVLIELGLLPSIDGSISAIPESCLHINDSDRFECRPTYLKHENKGNCVLTNKIPFGSIRMIPSAHAEGKLILSNTSQEKVLKILEKNDQIVFRYVDPEGNYEGYPWNPNGSFHNIAGICNRDGNVFGMMPHPERVFHRYQHPDWTRSDVQNPVGDGKIIFESIISYIEKKF
jgi:phosphoribosylformylglycinamidine synthase subunit PurQ / glutaminase